MEYAPTVWDPVCQMHIQLLATTMTLRQLRRWWGLPEDRIHADYWQEIAIFQMSKFGQGYFWHLGLNFNKLRRGPLGNAAYQMAHVKHQTPWMVP